MRHGDGKAGGGVIYSVLHLHNLYGRMLHVWFCSRHWGYESGQSVQMPTLMELKSWWQRKIIDKLNKIGAMLDVNFKEQKTK